MTPPVPATNVLLAEVSVVAVVLSEVVVPPTGVWGGEAEVHADGKGNPRWWCYPTLGEFGSLDFPDQDTLPCLGVGVAIGDDASLVEAWSWLWPRVSKALNVEVK
jgi:hypothetical protein